MQQPSIKSRTRRHGFSIVELLVVISIIGLLLGISFPFISAMISGSRIEAGLNTAGMASDVARQWVQAEAWVNDGGTSAPTLESYSGTAALFCPTQEIRIVKNHRHAWAATGSPIHLEDRGTSINGYIDLPQVEYIKIPDDVGLAGIYKDPANGRVKFIAPPFAIAYNELGQLTYGDADGLIYYDANGNARYKMSSNRPSNYNPSDWANDREKGQKDPNGDDNYTNLPKLTLPFEAIECVPGIIVFSEKAFRESSFSFDNGGSIQDDTSDANDAFDWLKENGRTIFFSPHTGIALRDEQG